LTRNHGLILPSETAVTPAILSRNFIARQNDKCDAASELRNLLTIAQRPRRHDLTLLAADHIVYLTATLSLRYPLRTAIDCRLSLLLTIVIRHHHCFAHLYHTGKAEIVSNVKKNQRYDGSPLSLQLMTVR